MNRECTETDLSDGYYTIIEKVKGEWWFFLMAEGMHNCITRENLTEYIRRHEKAILSEHYKVNEVNL